MNYYQYAYYTPKLVMVVKNPFLCGLTVNVMMDHIDVSVLWKILEINVLKGKWTRYVLPISSQQEIIYCLF